MSVSPWIFCQCMLLLNAVWDLVSCLSIWYSFGFRYEDTHIEKEDEVIEQFCSQRWQERIAQKIAEMHTTMWSRREDELNYAAGMLMACLVITFCIIRLYSAIDKKYIILAVVSYAIEGFFFLLEGFKGTMDPYRAYSAGIVSFFCMIFCFINIP
jgi:hypothetical protein